MWDRGSSDWATVLDDVFEAIVGHLDSTSIANIRLTCKEWRSKTSRLLQVRHKILWAFHSDHNGCIFESDMVVNVFFPFSSLSSGLSATGLNNCPF